MDNPCSSIKWADCVRISDDWIKKYLKAHSPQVEKKLVVRAYTIQFSGTEYQINALVDCIAEYIKYFVLSPDDIKKLQTEGKDPYRQALHYFGDVDPERDGKYGELILFLFTESVLKAPMIAYKLGLLSNVNDQVKGGDGVFFGEYKGQPSLFIGESKIEKELSTAVKHALESLDRFHDEIASVTNLKHELNVANRVIRKDFSADQLDYLYDSLDPETERYKKNNKVHPILIIYNDDKIKSISTECCNSTEAEELLKTHIEQRINKAFGLVKGKVENYENIQPVFLDFFFFPVTDVTKLRYALYKAIHGCEYRKTPKSTGGR